MAKTIWLKDGTEAIIRELTEGDLDLSFAFFQGLGPEDKAYLRVDVSDREVVWKRLRNERYVDVKRIVAEVDGEIVADAALELNPHGWERHLAEFRLIVASEFKRKGLGMFMAEELYEMAIQEQVEEMTVQLMGPQKEAKKIFERLGFRQDAVLKDFVKDVKGQRQDLIIMRCSLDDIWNQIESYFEEFEGMASQEMA